MCKDTAVLSDFKVGDKVRTISTEYPNNFPVGATGVVVGLTDGGVGVIADNPLEESIGMDWYFYPTELELVS